jgi:hypothetical protein
LSIESSEARKPVTLMGREGAFIISIIILGLNRQHKICGANVFPSRKDLDIVGPSVSAHKTNAQHLNQVRDLGILGLWNSPPVGFTDNNGRHSVIW